MSNSAIRRALLSVSDKTDIVGFARALRERGVEILSTGGTARTLREAGVELREVEEHTGFPEIMDGRVKTLHPKVHGGILFRRDDESHRQAANQHGIDPIDLVAVNLYPFEETVAKGGVTREEAVEQIDIGGPSMIRSAAKNHADVTVVSSPDFYSEIIEEMDRLNGATSLELRQRLSLEAFRKTAAYDRAISEYFGAESAKSGDEVALPSQLSLSLPMARRLRYGENPHQLAAVYGNFLERIEQLHGKELSYNNILDLGGALEVASRIAGFGDVAVSIIKHSNPCGAAVGPDVASAYQDALATDPTSASGGIIAVSAPVDARAAEAMSGQFIEILAAPDFSAEALEILRRKKNRILLRTKDDVLLTDGDLLLRSLPGGVLAQTADVGTLDASELSVVTERAPTPDEMRALRFAWEIVKCVKSNAIVYTAATKTLGVGAGQMSRVDSARVAAFKAEQAGLSLEGSVVASDAFFPFADGLITASEAGATAVIQPGGSVRDKEVIAAANERGLAMVFTGRRHFRH